MFFRDIIGQEEVKQRLIASVKSGHIAHAQLFAGPEGVGKLALAMAYARYIQCTNRGETDACGTCPSCVKHSKLMHPDCHYVFPIIKKGENPLSAQYLDDWRRYISDHPYPRLSDWMQEIGAENKQGAIFVSEADAIIDRLTVKPYESDYRIMIIWLPEKMNEMTANKILKILEEPYEKTVFLLVSNEPDALLATIRSRTQAVYIRPVEEPELAEALQSRHGVAPADSLRIAHMANGNVLRALDSLEENEERSRMLDLFIRMMRLSYGRKLKEMKLWSEEVAGMGRERQKSFLQYAQQLIRENFIYNFGLPQLNYMQPDEEAFSQRFAPFVNERNTEGIMETLELAEQHITQNANPKMVFFDLALKFIMLLKN
jgi:DNA polymerase-3 subunit delta'